MKVWDLSKKKGERPEGKSIMIYGEPDVGKTYSASTLTGRTCMIVNEPKNPVNVLREPLEGQTGKDITFVSFDGGFREQIKFLDTLIKAYRTEVTVFKDGKPVVEKNKFNVEIGGKVITKPFDNLFIDGASFMQRGFKSELDNSRFKANYGGMNPDDVPVHKGGIEMKDWGTLSEWMQRVNTLAVNFTKYGVNVIVTAHKTEAPSYNRALVAAPFFQGKDFTKTLSGYYDHVALIEKDPQSTTGYPPLFKCVSNDNSYLARCSSVHLRDKMTRDEEWARLDFEQLFKDMEG